jgi:hypothetical protein
MEYSLCESTFRARLRQYLTVNSVSIEYENRVSQVTYRQYLHVRFTWFPGLGGKMLHNGNEVWSMDFVIDTCVSSRFAKILLIINKTRCT